jgi:hypothetical protein
VARCYENLSKFTRQCHRGMATNGTYVITVDQSVCISHIQVCNLTGRQMPTVNTGRSEERSTFLGTSETEKSEVGKQKRRRRVYLIL